MLVANDSIQDRCVAWKTDKDKAPFFCPECNKEVTLKKGRIREHHFAHLPPVSCIYGQGESDKHFKIKRAIYEALSSHPNCSKCEVERILKGVRPDISLYVHKTPVAIEIQKSSIDINEIIRRTKKYSDLKIHLIWIIPDDTFTNAKLGKNNKLICRPKEWQKFLHAMYYGRIYVWHKEALVKPVHLDPYKWYFEKGNWIDDHCEKINEDLENTYWYSDNYDNAHYGGFWKTSKSEKELVYPDIPYLHLAEDFRDVLRENFHTNKYEIPSCKLWTDKQQKWW